MNAALRLGAWFLLCFGAFLAAGTPADLVLRRAGADLSPLVLEGVHGTLLEGRSTRAAVHGVVLGELGWSLLAAGLLRGCVRYALGGATLSAQAVSLCLGGTRQISGATLQTDVRALPVPAAGGRLTVRIDEARLAAGGWDAMRGEAAWSDATISLGQSLVLGAVSATFEAVAGDLVARVRNDGGDVRLQATLRLRHDGAWSLEGRMDDVRDDEAGRALRALFGATADGAIPLRLSGRLAR